MALSAEQHAANVEYWENAYTGRGPLPGHLNRVDALERLQAARKAQRRNPQREQYPLKQVIQAEVMQEQFHFFRWPN